MLLQSGCLGKRFVAKAALLVVLLGGAGVLLADPVSDALNNAAFTGDIAAVRLALLHGAQPPDVTACSDALRSAIAGFGKHPTESKQIIKLLLDDGANINTLLGPTHDKPVYRIRSAEALEFLLGLGATPDADGYDGLVGAIARDPNIEEPIRMLNLVLSHGGRLTGASDRDVYILQIVAQQHRAELVEFLLAHGFSPNLRDGSGQTALFDAADAATIDVLLRGGAELDALDTAQETPLAEAISKKNVAKSLLLLARGASPHLLIGPPSWRVSAVQFAIENDELDLVAALVAKGASVNGRASSGLSPLEDAIRRGNVDLVELLVAHEANVNATASSGEVMASVVACRETTGDPIRILTILLDHGARLTGDVKRGQNILHCAVKAHSVDLEEFVLTQGVSPDIRDEWDRTALFWATDADTIDPLLRHHADIEAVNKVGSTALADAVVEDEVGKSLHLLAAGANPNVLLAGEWSEPLLSIAAAHGQVQILTELLARGAHVNAQDRSGKTALHAAVDAGQLEATKVLLAQGADINGKDFQGYSAIHHAAIRNDAAMVAYLLSQHADGVGTDSPGNPPYRLATSPEVIALFERNGAPVEPQLPTKRDEAACQQVVDSRLWRGRHPDGANADSPFFFQDPRDNWNFQTGVMVEDINEKVLHLGGQDYVLGVWSGELHAVFVDDFLYSGPTPPEVQARLEYEMSHQKAKRGPVYLARLGTDQVEKIVCEYKRTGVGIFERYSVMTPSERLKARPPKDPPQ